MKKILTLAVFTVVMNHVYAQDVVMSKDEHGRLIHYEVVQSTVGVDTLSLRAKSFFERRHKELKLTKVSGDTSFTALGKVIVNKTETFLTHPDGEVSFLFVVELKSRKYRFWLTDFQLLPYQRDRYGNFLPATSVKIPLEKPQSKLNASQWKVYERQVAKFVKKFSEKFKVEMANPLPKATDQREKVIPKEW